MPPHFSPASRGPEATPASLRTRLMDTRGTTAAMVEGLSDADATVQSMHDASPAKWHLAHTSWFFEALVLVPHDDGYRPFDPRYAYLFNSYYETLGERHPRPRRGMLTRPDLSTILAYREHVERALASLFDRLGTMNPERADALRRLLELGVQHEQQHQELLLTDLLHLFSLNPLSPVYRDAPSRIARRSAPDSDEPVFVEFPGGRFTVGHGGEAFAYDCEAPAHDVWLQPFALASRPTSNREWRAFIDDGGYRDPLLWLSDGWDRVREERWEAPLYWRRDGDDWKTMSLHGERTIDPDAPVTHLSYYEADAFARWAGRRLPTEFEWETAARSTLRGPAAQSVTSTAEDAPIVDGHFADDGLFVPAPASGPGRMRQLFGDVWEWTSSAFAPYPGFRPAAGAAGEYNGKFMCGQYVLRGGSCATPRTHVRATYRNFFPPTARWQFSGLRLAEDRS